MYFVGNPFPPHVLKQSFRPTQQRKQGKCNKDEKYNYKNNIKLIYLTFMHCTCKFEKHKQSFLSENYEQSFPNNKHKQSNAHEKHKQYFPELFHQPTLMHNFLYSLTICLLHYYSRHVSSINMPIFRRKNCIHTASGIFALCIRLHSTLV